MSVGISLGSSGSEVNYKIRLNCFILNANAFIIKCLYFFDIIKFCFNR